jgi:hypothetical protein
MSTSSPAVAVVFASFLLVGCVKTKVTPLGTTQNGRRQWRPTMVRAATRLARHATATTKR